MTTTSGLKSGLLAGWSALAVMAGAPANAGPSDQARDDRIAKLEAAVATLETKVEQQNQLQQRDDAIEKENAILKGEVEDLNAQVADLKSSTVEQLEDVRETDDKAPKVSFPNGRPTFSTADGAFTVSLRGVLQFDSAAYFQGAAGPTSSDFRRDGPALGTSGIDAAHARDLKDGDLWRRARIGFDGTAFTDFDYRLLFDFGGAGVENAGQLYEGWAQYSGLKPLHFRVGAFAPEDGLEDQGSTNGMLLLERPGISDVARNLAAGDTRTAAQVFANGDRWLVSGAVTGRTVGSINTGTAAATAQSFGDQIAFVGRGVVQPLHGSDWLVLTGVHGSYVFRPPDAAGPGANGVTPIASYQIRLRDTPELRVDGTQFIDTGSIDASSASEVGLEFAAQKKNFFLQSEYERIHVDRSDGIASPTFSGWYVEGAWGLTGEARKYSAGTGAFDAPPVKRPFDLHGGGWGAFELAVRYSDTDLNYDAGPAGSVPTVATIRGGDQQVITVGLNWYLNPVFRVMLDFDHVRIDRLSPNAAAYATPTGAQIGQSFNAVAVRTQAAF
jgi:phosphate-selective porin OprO/OprP